jgi:hypothetical protein
MSLTNGTPLSRADFSKQCDVVSPGLTTMRSAASNRLPSAVPSTSSTSGYCARVCSANGGALRVSITVNLSVAYRKRTHE